MLSINVHYCTIFDINVTPNRPDCLSHLGIAREISIMSGKNIDYPEDSVQESDIQIEGLVNITIKNKKACPRYSARVVNNVRVGSSPDWLKRYLENVGLRSVNNVVDITNYVLMETGQPLHAFDYDLISKKQIVVRNAYTGEEFTTLDDITHTLTKDDLLITQ